MKTNEKIGTIMTKNVISIHADDNLKIINETFRKHKFHHIPVIEHGKLVGIVSKADLLQLLSVRDQYSKSEFEKIKTRNIMTSKLLTLEPDDNIGLAADIFTTNIFHCIPISTDGVLKGIITTHDLLKHAFAE